jgi:hypothetical protein
MKHMAFLTTTDIVTQSELIRIAIACADQVRNHVAPRWGISAADVPDIIFAKDIASVPDGFFPVVAYGTPSDAPGTLAYHDETHAPVFVKDVIANGGDVLTGKMSIAATFSHEAVEGFLNENLDRWELGPDGALWAVEGCDAVENESYPHEPTGVSLSGFLLPAYFDASAGTGSRFDYTGALTKPYTIAHGGYAIRKVNGQIQEVFGSQYPEWKKPLKRRAARMARGLSGTTRV